jgi:hypothetical protein
LEGCAAPRRGACQAIFPLTASDYGLTGNESAPATRPLRT